jgi:hypothetical protein
MAMSYSDPTPEKALRANPGEPSADPLRRLCHEISGPLTSILVQCDLLLQEPLPPGSRERIAALHEEALRISRSLRAASRS